MNKETVIAKIQKLLALAGNNPNENERNAAMERAHRMLAQHNLELADVQKRATQQSFTVDNVEQHETTIVSSASSDMIVMGVCKLYYTACYRAERRYTIYGTPENIQATIAIATWLIKAIDNEAKRYPGGVSRNSFKRGAARAVYDNAVRLAKREAEPSTIGTTAQEDKQSFALMVVRNTLVKANEEYAKTKLNLRKGAARRHRNDYGAYAAGHSYGSGLNLGRQIAGTNAKRLNG